MASAETFHSRRTDDTLAQVGPALRAHRDDSERERHMVEPIAAALREAGLFRLFRPASRGGAELDPVSEFQLAEAIATIDAAAAWNLQVCNASELYGGWFADDVSAEIFGVPDSIVCGAFNPPRRAVPCEGGYRVTGTTPFNSHCRDSSWVLGLAHVEGTDGPDHDAKGRPETLLTAIPATECEIVDNWNTLGMRGTGSHDVHVESVFVPRERAVPFALEAPAPAYGGPLSRLVVWATAGAHAAVALGVAQSAIDELIALGSKVPAYTEGALSGRSRVQLRLASAEGRLGGARALFHQVFEEAWNTALEGRSLPLAQKARCQLACSSAVIAAAEAVDLVHGCVGTSGIREARRFERAFRDVHVITQHAFVAEARLESVGQVMLGLEPDWSFFQL